MSCLDALPFSLVSHEHSSTPPDLAVPTVDDLAARTGLPVTQCYCAHDSSTWSYPRRAHDTFAGDSPVVEGQGPLPSPDRETYDGGLATLAVHALSTNGEVVEGLYRVAESVARQGTTFEAGGEMPQ